MSSVAVKSATDKSCAVLKGQGRWIDLLYHKSDEILINHAGLTIS